MSNSRFAVSVHILTLLATAEREWLSSEYLAGSININPVLVRKELANLRQHGLVESKEGKNGGSRLARAAQKILLSKVYEAVKQDSLLGVSKNEPNPDCPVGRQINQHLTDLFSEAEKALVKQLGETTLAEFRAKFN